MQCEKCGGECWDNRKENAKRLEAGQKLRPDFSCKDKDGCGWVKWPPKTPKKENGKQAVKHTVVDIPATYGKSMDVALTRMVETAKAHPKLGAPTWENVIAATATVFIQACRNDGQFGVTEPAPAPEDEDDGLPY
jgi:hypothetical protein